MTTLRVPYLPPELVEMILEEAYPGLRRQPPRIAPKWLTKLVGEDFLAWIDRTPPHDYRTLLHTVRIIAFAPLAARCVLALRAGEMTPVRMTAFDLAAACLYLAGLDPWVVDEDGIIFVEQEHCRQLGVSGYEHLPPSQRMTPPAWSTRLRARYRLGLHDSRFFVRLELLGYLIHVIVIFLVYLLVIPVWLYVVTALPMLLALTVLPA
ncbi:hypothetical protein JCM10450v2_007121 [Rhodotorula kratochvilovae]